MHTDLPQMPPELILKGAFTPERLRRVASANYDYDGDGIYLEFRQNLDTGLFAYAGDGNPYECALMQRHDMTSDRPLNELFGAWWIGAFCSEPEHFVLINNLAIGGVDALLHMVVRGCGELGHDAAAAAHAAIPFVRFLQGRTPFPEEASFDEAIAALDAIERLGSVAKETGPYLVFMTKCGESSEP